MILNLLDFVNKTLAIGTIASQIFILLAVLYVLLPVRKESISGFFAKNGIKLAFIVSLFATAVSLFYSNYAGFLPCPLCWFQRIFMYPEVIILGLALIKKDNGIIDYGLALSIIGWFISVYQNYISISAVPSAVCTLAEPCTTVYVLEYGYVTIPVMALTGFSLIILILSFKKYYGKD